MTNTVQSKYEDPDGIIDMQVDCINDLSRRLDHAHNRISTLNLMIFDLEAQLLTLRNQPPLGYVCVYAEGDERGLFLTYNPGTLYPFANVTPVIPQHQPNQGESK